MVSFQRTSLIRLADYINGFAFKPEDHTEEGLPIIRIEQLKDRSAPFDHYDKPAPPENLIANGDLIFSWSASLFLQIWDRGDAILNQHLFKVVPKGWVDKTFLKYCIEFNLPELVKAAHGSTMQHITRRELERFHVQVPVEKVIQSTIAAILTTVDRAIEQTEALIAKYQRIKTGLMHDLLTRGIDKHGQLRDPATHKFKPSPLGMIPEEWDATMLGDCSELHNHLRKPISSVVRESMKGQYPYYGATGIVDFVNEYRVEGKFVLIGEDGDHFLKFLQQEMTILAEGKFNVSNHAHILRGKERCSTEWIYHFFAHRDVTFYLTRQGAGRFKLNKATLLSLPIALPSPQEQEAISDGLYSAKHEIESLYRQLSKLQRLKTGLMQDLLTGKVSVAGLIGTDPSGLPD